MPYVISRGTDKEAKFFNVHGQNIFTVSFSNFLDDNESASFLWNDTPLYGVHVLNDGAIVESETAWYIEGGETAESFICHTFAPELTDTVEQWGNIFSKMSNYLFAHPNRPNFNGGGGMIPMHFPMGYIEGVAQAETVSRPPMLAYIKDGKLVTDTGYAVLAVCGESMVWKNHRKGARRYIYPGFDEQQSANYQLHERGEGPPVLYGWRLCYILFNT